MNIDVLCPKCHCPIPLDDVNVSTDIALCRRCKQRWSYAEILEEQEADPVDPMRPPSGAWFVPSPRGFEVGASTRSPVAFFLVPFMCIWSGGSLSGIYGTQLATGNFDLAQSLFGIPFLIGTLLFGSFALMSVCGKVVAKVADNTCTLFTGIGPIGRRRTLNWSQVTEIRQTMAARRRQSGEFHQITITAGKTYNFASGLKRLRQDFMLAMLRQKWRETNRR